MLYVYGLSAKLLSLLLDLHHERRDPSFLVEGGVHRHELTRGSQMAEAVDKKAFQRANARRLVFLEANP